MSKRFVAKTILIVTGILIASFLGMVAHEGTHLLLMGSQDPPEVCFSGWRIASDGNPSAGWAYVATSAYEVYPEVAIVQESAAYSIQFLMILLVTVWYYWALRELAP